MRLSPTQPAVVKSLEPKRRSLSRRPLGPSQSSVGQGFDAEDSALPARGHAADLGFSLKDRVSVMQEPVSKSSVIGEGFKRSRVRTSGPFGIPRSLAMMLVMVVGAMVGPASSALGAGAVGWGVHVVSQPSSFGAADTAACEA
jgi:hypothetical protein